jgi:hypothetical protein
VTIAEAIEKADALYPNSYRLREKLDWCHDVSALLRREVCREYEEKRYELSKKEGQNLLPRGVEPEDVEYVIAGGKRLTRTDLRSFFHSQGLYLPKEYSGRVRLVYLRTVPAYRIVKVSAEAVIESGTLTMEPLRLSGFCAGDFVSIWCGTEGFVVQIQRVDYAKGTVSLIGEIKDYTGTVKVTKLIRSQTECPAPYDEMYVDYLLGKMAYYQNDIALYNQHMTQFNSRISDYERYHKQHSAVDNDAKFCRVWG